MSGTTDSDWDISRDPAQGLFFVQITLQKYRIFALADSGASRNLMSHQRYETLHVRPRLTPSRGLKVIGGNGLPIPLLGFADFAVKVADAWICHGFGIVDDLPLDVILGAEILKLHGALLTYQPQGDNVLSFALNSCRVCVQAFLALSRAGDPQLRYCEPELLLPSSALPPAPGARAEEPLAALHSLFDSPSSPRTSALARSASRMLGGFAHCLSRPAPDDMQAPRAKSHSQPSSPRGHSHCLRLPPSDRPSTPTRSWRQRSRAP